ncbi:MAG: DHH family phosphoesterase [Planctomycetota bacterium]
MDAFLDLLRTRQSFWLSGHENPDGDCIGAQVALFHLLRQLGKDVTILNPDPPQPSLDFVTHDTPFAAYGGSGELPAAEVLVLLDCAWIERLGALGREVREHRPAVVAVLDHHVGSEAGDGDVCYVDAAAPSTGSLVHRLYQALSQPVSAPAAEGIFLSLVADTGWFRYSNTTPEVLRTAAAMLEVGVDASLVYDEMFRRNHPDTVALLAHGLGRTERVVDGRYAFAVLDRASMDHSRRVGFDTDAVMEPLRSVAGTEVVALFKELGPNLVKLSLRAVRDVDVQAIAKEFGGGGHKKAAGAQLRMPMAEAVLTVRTKVEQAIARAAARAT